MNALQFGNNRDFLTQSELEEEGATRRKERRGRSYEEGGATREERQGGRSNEESEKMTKLKKK